MSNAKITGLQFDIEASSKEAANSIEKLATAMVKGESGSEKMAKGLEKVATSLKSFDDSSVEKLNHIADALEKISKNDINLKLEGLKDLTQAESTLNKIEKTVEHINELGNRNPTVLNPVDPTFQKTKSGFTKDKNFEKRMDAIEKLSDNVLTGWDTVFSDSNMFGIFDKSLDKIGDSLIKFNNAMATTFSKGKIAFQILNSLISVARTFAKVISAATKKILEFGGAFLKSLGNRITAPIKNIVSAYENLKKRILSTMLTRAIRNALKQIYKAMQEGIENMYEWSRTSRTSFVSAMDSISTSALYLKNSLGAMLAPAIEALAPVIDFIVDKFVSLLNVINQVISLLGGKGYWTKAVKNATTYGDAVSGAGKAAKDAADDLKLFLAPWDELHLTDDPNSKSSGGGSGGGGGATDYSTMFENTPYDETLKDLIENGDWYGIGELFGQKLNIITQAADDWILDTFDPWLNTTFVPNLVNAVNGFIATYDFSLLGKTFADGINTLVTGATTWWNNIEWNLFGTKIGEMVNKWFDTVDWGSLDNEGNATGIAGYFVAKFNGAIDFFSGLITKLFGEGRAVEIGKKLSNSIKIWFDKVEWTEAGQTIVDGLNGLIDAFGAFVDNDEMWASAEKGMNNFFSSFSSLKIANLAQSLSKAFIKVMDLIPWDEVGKDIGTFLGNLEWFEIIKSVLSAAWETIKSAFDEFWQGDKAGQLATILMTAIGSKILISTLLSHAAMGAVEGAIEGASGTGLLAALAGVLGISTGSLALIAGAIVLTIGITWFLLETETGQTILQGIELLLKKKFPFLFPDSSNNYIDIKDLPEEKQQKITNGTMNKLSNFYGVEIPATVKLEKAGEIQKKWDATFGKVDTNEKVGLKYPTTNEINNGFASALRDTNANKDVSFKYPTDSQSRINTILGAFTSKKSIGFSYPTSNDSKQGIASILAGFSINKGIGFSFPSSETSKTNAGNSLKWSISKLIGLTFPSTTTTKSDATKAVNWSSGISKLIGLIFPSTATTKADATKAVNWNLNKNIGFTLPTKKDIQEKMQNILDNVSAVLGVDVEVPNIQYVTSGTTGYAKGTGTTSRVKADVWKAKGAFDIPFGEMFIAREAGPELVGRIGNHNSVVNNEQIVESISRGVRDAMLSSLGVANGNQNLTVYLDGEVVYNNVVNRNNAKVARTGASDLIV